LKIGKFNLYLLETIAAENLADIAASKGRTVGEQFAHLHNTCLMWFREAAPELLEGLEKIEKEKGITKPQLQNCLTASGIAVESY
jgi:hypothetical protein